LAYLLSPRELEEYLLKHGGQSLYLPKPAALQREVRDLEMRSEFLGGATYEALARRYGLSTRQVRRIVDSTDQAA
jgi:Mor family transcriptional regulator